MSIADDIIWSHKEKSVFKEGDFVDNWVDHNSVSRGKTVGRRTPDPAGNALFL